MGRSSGLQERHARHKTPSDCVLGGQQGGATHGHTALNSMLASCAPGLGIFNIDNGYGAACAAARVLYAIHGLPKN